MLLDTSALKYDIIRKKESFWLTQKLLEQGYVDRGFQSSLQMFDRHRLFQLFHG